MVSAQIRHDKFWSSVSILIASLSWMQVTQVNVRLL